MAGILIPVVPPSYASLVDVKSPVVPRCSIVANYAVGTFVVIQVIAENVVVDEVRRRIPPRLKASVLNQVSFRLSVKYHIYCLRENQYLVGSGLLLSV
jgi:hypothetical protein